MNGVADDRVRRLLEYDPLGEAEAEAATTGASPLALAFRNVMASGAAKERALAKREDTFWACPIDYFLGIVAAEGFVQIDERPEDDVFGPYVERLHWNPQDAILLRSSSYTRRDGEGPGIDAASMLFNCLVPFGSWKKLRGATGNQSPVKLPSGDEFACRYTLDGREALRFKLKVLRTHGTFANPWVLAPGPAPLAFEREWGQHRQDFSVRLETAQEASDARLRRMPEDVRRCLAVCEEKRR